MPALSWVTLDQPDESCSAPCPTSPPPGGNPIIDINALRIIRIFRVFRIFGKFASMRQIINALFRSIFPVCSALLMFWIILSIYAIIGKLCSANAPCCSLCQWYTYLRVSIFNPVGVNLFKEHVPERFGAFSTASFAMFQASIPSVSPCILVFPLQFCFCA
jgi:hypothetical protein